MAHPLHAFFAKIPLFSGLSVEELEDVIRAVRPVQIPDGELVFAEGDAGDAAYVLESGLVEVFRRVDGRDQPLARLGPNEVFGELALIDGAARSAAVRTLDDCTLFRLDKAEFDFLRRNYRPAAYSLIRSISGTICGRIRETNQQVTRLLDPEQPSAVADEPQAEKSWLKRLWRGRR